MAPDQVGGFSEPTGARTKRPLRVLHVGKYLPPFAGGMEHFLWDLLQAQQAAGTEAAALVHHERPGWFSVQPGPADQPTVYRAPCLGRVLYVPVAPSFPLWLSGAIRRFRPDLLHLHLPNSSALMALALPSARRLPWVVHWHADLVASELDRRLALAYRLYRPLEQQLLRRSRVIIATSPPYLEASAALAPWRARCRVVPLGLDSARLTEPSEAALATADLAWGQGGPRGPGRLRVLAIGRLTYYKGHEALLRALAKTPDVDLVIVGRGEREARLRGLIAKLGLDARVNLRTGCSDEQVAALLRRCDLLCLPSLERTEAFGLVLLEAMQAAKPVLVSDIPGSGASWVVQQARHGWLVAPGDVAGLADALNRIRQAPEQRLCLGVNAAQALDREFGIQQVAAAINALYLEALEIKPTGGE
ncbi:MAG: glycosyltransferase [Chromatiaceae bacterium]|nr:glycosyltransferase [Chromatiaceae bacterium]MCF7993348.1 glycosyltransferase [Chromatiaceae bacterium]